MDNDRIMTYRNRDIQARTCAELIGICKGIISDGKVCASEADFLYNWLCANPSAAEVFPGSILANRLIVMLSDDDVFDDEECKELLHILQDATGENGVDGTSPILGFDNPMPELCFAGACFCLTGTFQFDMRSNIERILSMLGAEIKTSVPKRNPCTLVVGSMVSESWKFSTHGRKLETAILLREEGYPISVVSEDHLFKELERLGMIAV